MKVSSSIEFDLRFLVIYREEDREEAERAVNDSHISLHAHVQGMKKSFKAETAQTQYPSIL